MSIENPPAFPVSCDVPYYQEGMTMRDWFAGRADSEAIDPYREYGNDMGRTNTDVEARYAFADAMLAERAKVNP